MFNIVINCKQGINFPGILYYNEFVFVIFKINFRIIKNLHSLDNHSGIIGSYKMKSKNVHEVPFINFLEKPANSILFVIRNISKL